MAKEKIPFEKGKVIGPKRTTENDKQDQNTNRQVNSPDLTVLQEKIGNRAIQRLISQRSGGEKPFELDEETGSRINQERGGGHMLDETTQEKMGGAMDHDFRDVRIHTSPESDDLNRTLKSNAFTTGQDIFFREGTYNPNSSKGQDLIAHELTHVVQQSKGVVSGGSSGMMVNAPGDAFEQEAEAVAQEVNQSPTVSKIQRQEEEEEIQMQEEEEEEAVQMQEEEEEEEAIQMQTEEDEEDEEIMP